MLNIPNSLSVFRIVLIPVYLYIFLTAQEQPMFLLSALILLISALTDMADGFIARKYDMVTQLGKLLDPVADKLTLAAVVVSLWIKIPQLWPLFLLFIFKEILMVIGGVKLIRSDIDVAGAKWFGKLYTVVFYIVTIWIVANPLLDQKRIFGMLLFMGIFTLFSFVMYIIEYKRLVGRDPN